MSKKLFFFIMSILVLKTSASYAMYDDLEERKKAVNRQLEVQQQQKEWFELIGAPTPTTLHESIQRTKKFTPPADVKYMEDVNKSANKAKHDWNTPFIYNDPYNNYSNHTYSSHPGTTYQNSGNYRTSHEARVNNLANEMLEDSRRNYQRNTGRDLDRDFEESCTLQ